MIPREELVALVALRSAAVYSGERADWEAYYVARARCCEAHHCDRFDVTDQMDDIQRAERGLVLP